MKQRVLVNRILYFRYFGEVFQLKALHLKKNEATFQRYTTYGISFWLTSTFPLVQAFHPTLLATFARNVIAAKTRNRCWPRAFNSTRTAYPILPRRFLPFNLPLLFRLCFVLIFVFFFSFLIRWKRRVDTIGWDSGLFRFFGQILFSPFLVRFNLVLNCDCTWSHKRVSGEILVFYIFALSFSLLFPLIKFHCLFVTTILL